MENVVPVRKKLPEGVPSVVLNSADFGVPQTRRRCYAGEGWAACPSHTKEEWVSVIEALPHLEGELTLDNVMLNTAGCGASGGRRAASADSSVESQSLTIHNNPPSLRSVRLEALGSNAKRSADTDLEIPSKTICGSGNQVGPRMFAHPVNVNTAGASESIGPAATSRDRSISKPSHTLYSHHVSLRDKSDPEKPVKIRSLTLPETLVLQGFNPDYDLSAARTMKSRWTMVGNAVPPPVAEAVIRGIHNDEGN
jgi:site-specific DNA-cytosine methylase